MSFESLSQRLSELQDSNSQLKDLINRLATINFQPGSVPLDREEGNVVTELASEIRQTLKDQDEDFELLEEEVIGFDVGRMDVEGTQRKEGLEGDVKMGIRELKNLQTAFRKAQLSAKRNVEAARRFEKELLLRSYLEPPQPVSDASSPTSDQAAPALLQRRRSKRGNLSKEEKTVSAASDVTMTLRRTHDMMLGELTRSQFAHDTLKESTAALAGLSENYSTLDNLLSTSKNLVGTLLRSQKSDTWYLETAFYVLAVTIGWLVYRRLLYGPTWWLLWFPLKMFFKGSTGLLTTMGVIGGSSVSVAVSSGVAAGVTGVMHSSGTRGPRPTVTGAGAPSVNVGGGGRGAPPRGTNSPAERRSEETGESVSEQVGRIIDESQNAQAGEGTSTEEELPQEGTGEELQSENADATQEEQVQRNPKKRMWEEPVEAKKEAQRVKDEL